MRRNYRHWTNEGIIDFIQKRTFELNRTLTLKDVSQYLGKIACKRFGSWDKTLMLATGRPSTRHKRSPDDLLARLRQLEKEWRHTRLPEINDISAKEQMLIKRHFGSFYDALELAIGSSQRIIILKAVQQLTPLNCPDASTPEIAELLRSQGYEYNNLNISSRLKDLRVTGFVSGGKINRTALWRLTQKGKQFLNQQKERH